MHRIWSRFCHRWLSPGEALAAPSSLAIVAILCGAMLAAGWWSIRSQRDVLADARQTEVTAVAGTIKTASELMMSSGQLSALRRLMIESAREYQLDHCRVVLPDGSIIADQDPRQINQASLPVNWPDGRNPRGRTKVLADRISIIKPLHVPQHGEAALVIRAGPRMGLGETWLAHAGVGAVGVGSLVALLLVLRNLRTRLRPLGAIDESLTDFHDGQTAGEALRIDSDQGPTALAWNELLSERDRQLQTRRNESTQAALVESSADSGDLTHVCNALSQGLILFDPQLTIRYLNGAAAVFLAGKRDELNGKSLDELTLSEPVRDALRQAVSGSTRQRRTLESEPENAQADNVLRFLIRPITSGQTPAAVMIIDDITQQRVAEQSHQSFLSQATHELRTPLTNIRLYLDNALESGDDDAEMRGQALNVIGQESRRLEQLVEDMLNVSQIEAGSMSLEFGDVRLDALFDDLRCNYQAQAADRQIAFSVNVPPKLPVIQADRQRLTVALQNLVGNALKYTPDQGTVETTVETSAEQLTVEVKDTGFGIREEDIERIFDKFYRAQNKQTRQITGTGLGLALSREIARLHGGEITVESVVDQGSTFTLTIPISVEAGR